MAFADDFFEGEMPKSHIPGVAIAIVKDGEVFYTQGYGYADVAQNTPVEADKTLFRVASLSKTFTSTATMQLHERGVIEVNEDIIPYLGEQVTIDNPYSEPVTFARMMMHNDGTTRRTIGLAASTPEKMKPLGEYLSQNMPAIAIALLSIPLITIAFSSSKNKRHRLKSVPFILIPPREFESLSPP